MTDYAAYEVTPEPQPFWDSNAWFQGDETLPDGWDADLAGRRVADRRDGWGGLIMCANEEFRDHLLRIARDEPMLIHCESAESIADCVLNLATERDRLAAQVAELVALLKVYPHGDGCEPACDAAVVGDDPDSCGGCDGERNANGENIGGFCWEHRRRALLARIGATP